MPRALEVVDDVLQHQERGEVTFVEAIDELLFEEYAFCEGRRIAALNSARLTPIKMPESLDFSFRPSLDRYRVIALASSSSLTVPKRFISSSRPAPAKDTWRLLSG